MSKILIIKLGAMGDVLRTTAILEGLKEKHKAEVWWITKKESYEILKNNKIIDNVLVYDGKLINKLKDEKFDLVINLDEDYEACKLASEVNSRKIVGAYLKNGKQTYTDDSRQWFDMGLISKYGKEEADRLKKLNKKTYQKHLCEILGIKPGNVILNLGKEDLKFAENFAKKNGIDKSDILIGINTGAGKRWRQKSLSIEKTAKIVDAIADELDAKIILFGGKEEKERNEKIKKITKARIIDAGCDNSLLEFASLVNLCSIIVTSDSLALHIATALDKKVAVFFGPTGASEIELYGLGKKIVAKMDCLCCYKKECNKKPNCMDKIDVQEIVSCTKTLTKK